MNAEIGINHEGRAYITLSHLTQTEWAMLEYLKAWLPVKYDLDGMTRIYGDRLPGSGAADDSLKESP